MPATDAKPLLTDGERSNLSEAFFAFYNKISKRKLSQKYPQTNSAV
jgi:hypothetical protein